MTTYPSGRTVTYTRDAIGRVTDVATDLGGMVVLASGGTYEAFGPVNGLVYGNGVTLALGHDLDGRRDAMDAFDGGLAVLDLDYAFDLAGNITGVTDVGLGPRGRAYIYDALHRLVDASGGIPTETYSYDSVGNRAMSAGRWNLMSTTPSPTSSTP